MIWSGLAPMDWAANYAEVNIFVDVSARRARMELPQLVKAQAAVVPNRCACRTVMDSYQNDKCCRTRCVTIAPSTLLSAIF